MHDPAWLGLPRAQEAGPCVSVTVTLLAYSMMEWEPQKDLVSARGRKPQLSSLRATLPS